MNTNTLSTSFTRFMRVLGGIRIAPALFFPFYQALLHGGCSAAESIPRAFLQNVLNPLVLLEDLSSWRHAITLVVRTRACGQITSYR